MDSDLPASIDIVWPIILLLCNCLFAGAEYALLRTFPAELKTSDGAPKRFSGLALWLLKNFDLSFTLAQVGRGTTTLLLGWYGVQAIRLILSSHFLAYAIEPSGIVLYYAVGLTGILFLVVVPVVSVGLIGKSVALAHPERTLRLLSPPFVLLSLLLKPLIYLARGLANAVLRIFGTQVPATSCKVQGNSELTLLFRERSNGPMDHEEEKMIRGVVGFSETVAREVMTPRTDIVTIEAKSNFRDVLKVVVESGFSRFPVRGKGIDDVVGVLLVKDLLPLLTELETGQNSAFSLKQTMRKPYFIPGTKPVDDLLNEFRKRKLHMAIVLDEHGGVDGLVTLEDLLEEIVGDIFDESDTEDEIEIVDTGDGELKVDGGVLVTDLNERYKLVIPEGDYDTIAGFIFTTLGKMPKIGDQITIGQKGDISISTPIRQESSGQVISGPQSSAAAGSELTADPANSDRSHEVFAEQKLKISRDLNGEHSVAPVFSSDSNGNSGLTITVEKIASHRIEIVKIRRLNFNANLESLLVRKAS